MKVKELIEKLKDCNPDAEVKTEGCDWFGDVGFVDPNYLENGNVFLARSNGDYEDEKLQSISD